MYENVAERSESANRIANVRGLIRNFYSIDNFYASDEVADLFAAIAEAEAVIADWEVDHAEALGL